MDEDTLLLEFSLGQEHSYGWVVESAAVRGFELPPGAEIEKVARRLYDVLLARNRHRDDETLQQRRIQEAEQTFKQLAALPDKAYKPLHALFLIELGQRDAALREFEQLAAADPSDRASFRPGVFSHKYRINVYDSYQNK